jgi:hypothetical protein
MAKLWKMQAQPSPRICNPSPLHLSASQGECGEILRIDMAFMMSTPMIGVLFNP